MIDVKPTIWILKKALSKLTLYRRNSDGVYQGEMEYEALAKRIEQEIKRLEDLTKTETNNGEMFTL